MKKGSFIFLIFFMFQFSYSQMQLKAKDSLAIISILTKQEKAWNEGDINQFMEGYLESPKIVFSGANGPRYGWEAIKQRYLKTYPNKTQMGHLTFTILSMQQWTPNFVILEGKYNLERTVGDASGYFSLGWLRENGKWYMVNDHTTASNSKL